MRQLLSEILRLAELEISAKRADIPDELKRLVVLCGGEERPDYYAVDSGYVVRRIGNSDVLVQIIVAVGRDVRKKFVVTKVSENPHMAARINEINFAESIRSQFVLVDGPLTPYVHDAGVIGVSKDPRLVRYGPRIRDAELRDAFVHLAKTLGEREAAALLLRDAPPGSYLEPVKIGGLMGTYFKSEWVLYVEFPENIPGDLLCPLFRKYPIRLRTAHHLAKVNREFLKTLRAVASSILGTPPHIRDLL